MVLQKLVILSLAGASLLSTTARAGVGSSGGGNSVVCFNDPTTSIALRMELKQSGASFSDLLFSKKYLGQISSVRSYDLLLAEMPLGIEDPKLRYTLVQAAPQEKAMDIVNGVIARVSMLSNFGEMMRETIAKEIPVYTWKNAPGVLEMDDGDFRIELPMGCVRVQIAVRRGNQVHFNSRLFKMMSELDKAALILHEVVYKIAMDVGKATDSGGTQELVGMLLANADTYEQIFKTQVPQFNQEINLRTGVSPNAKYLLSFDGNFYPALVLPVNNSVPWEALFLTPTDEFNKQLRLDTGHFRLLGRQSTISLDHLRHTNRDQFFEGKPTQYIQEWNGEYEKAKVIVKNLSSRAPDEYSTIFVERMKVFPLSERQRVKCYECLFDIGTVGAMGAVPSFTHRERFLYSLVQYKIYTPTGGNSISLGSTGWQISRGIRILFNTSNGRKLEFDLKAIGENAATNPSNNRYSLWVQVDGDIEYVEKNGLFNSQKTWLKDGQVINLEEMVDFVQKHVIVGKDVNKNVMD